MEWEGYMLVLEHLFVDIPCHSIDWSSLRLSLLLLLCNVLVCKIFLMVISAGGLLKNSRA